MSIQQLRAMPSDSLRNFFILRYESAFCIRIAAAAPTLLSGLVVSHSRRIGNETPSAGPREAKNHLLGGRSSPASQPMASLFIGSTGNDTFSTRSQVLHSNVRSSKPPVPGEMRA